MIWWVISIGLVCIFLLLFSTIFVKCNYTYKQQNQFITVRVYFFRIRIFKKRINFESVGSINEDHGKPSDVSFSTLFHDSIRALKEFNSLLNTVSEKITVHQFEWYTQIGTGDAAMSGIVIGGAWTIKGQIVRLIYEKVSTSKMKPVLTITPLYNDKKLNTNIHFMISLKLGQAIYTLLSAKNNPTFKRGIFRKELSNT